MESQGACPLAVVVLTLDEEANLPACLASVSGLPLELFVVDSGSTDETVAIARRFGARVLSHPFESHARQWRWALANLGRRAPWVLGLDADQRLTPDLRDELARLFLREPWRLRGVDGFYVKRRQVFRGRWIRHGGYYPKYLLKLFRPEAIRLDEGDLIDHHFYVNGKVMKLENDLVEMNKKEDRISFWIEKHNRYAAAHAREEVARRRGDAPWAIRPSLTGSPDQRTVWLKERWYRLPLYVRPVVYFLYRYILRLGFLDGRQGFVFHFLHAYWYRLLVDINLDELSAGPGEPSGAPSGAPSGEPRRPARAPGG
jgi:glycosyltransferase involved in cell wall biosynthesis